jgi:hypothetical protein
LSARETLSENSAPVGALARAVAGIFLVPFIGPYVRYLDYVTAADPRCQQRRRRPCSDQAWSQEFAPRASAL